MEQLARKACQGRVVYLAASISVENLQREQSNYLERTVTKNVSKIPFVILSVPLLVKIKT
jgi:hypothetical protein